MALNSRVPSGPIDKKWVTCKKEMKLVNPVNKRKYTVIVVGTGLAGASCSASLGEMGYNVLSFCFQDSPRRAHSIAAQGGINAAKNYQNDGHSIYRLFYDTVKGGDFRARESNVYRLAELSVEIIDQARMDTKSTAPAFDELLEPTKNVLATAHPMVARGNRPLQMNFEQQLRALINFHLEEHTSGRHLIQAP